VSRRRGLERLEGKRARKKGRKRGRKRETNASQTALLSLDLDPQPTKKLNLSSNDALFSAGLFLSGPRTATPRSRGQQCDNIGSFPYAGRRERSEREREREREKQEGK